MINEARSIQHMEGDIAKSAAVLGVKFDPLKVRQVLKTFADGFSRSAVEFRTTTKPIGTRGLSFRYVELDRPHDPYQMACKNNLVGRQDRPICKLVPQLQDKFSIAGHGVDADASHGLEKIWPFLAFGYPLARLLELSAFPTAARHSFEYCIRHKLTHFSIISADYYSETANLYFMVPVPGIYTPRVISQMISELGFGVPSESVLQYNANAVAINLTFSYDSPDVERLCFYVPAPELDLVPQAVIEALNPALQDVPMIAPQRTFIIGHTFCKQSSYVKVEFDYSGTTLGCLQRCVGVPLAD